MSFALTTAQIKNRTKTVTRRCGWWFLKPGDIVNAVEKTMGLKKGEKIKRIGQVRIVNTRPEALFRITHPDVVREGFPEMSTDEFIDMFCRSHKGCLADSVVNRIKFEYV